MYLALVPYTDYQQVNLDWIIKTLKSIDIPEVSTDDNGKILKVVDGKWAASATSGSGGLPEVTDADNGKILIVSDGDWDMTYYRGLPSVTPNDNSKVLMVKGGVWSVESNVLGLPSVNASDNGYFLLVKDGSWTKEVYKGLPSVTPNQNDKVLMVKNGVWSVESNVIGLPPMTSADQGKMLQVNANGAWVAVDLDGNNIQY